MKAKQSRDNFSPQGAKDGEVLPVCASPSTPAILERLNGIESTIKMLADTMCVNQAIWKAMLRELMAANHKVGSIDLLP